MAVKDAQRVAGKRTTYGSLIFKDNIDERSDPMIERLEDAGAIIHARTTTPEFCLSGTCHTRMWGVTRNPFNTQFGPGGSSGGSGAVSRRRHDTLATGTDIGGSIRNSRRRLRRRRLQAAARPQSRWTARQFRPL